MAGGSDLAGECSRLERAADQLGAAGGSSPVIGVLTGILNQVLGLTGGNASSVPPLAIDVGRLDHLGADQRQRRHRLG